MADVLAKLNLRGNAYKVATVVLAVLLVAALAGLGVFWKRYHDIEKDPQKVAQDQTKALVSQVSQLIELPTGEDPTVATVTDLGPLKGQQFFANAKVGDKVLVYTSAKKAILYDPNTNKIVEVAPINIGSNTPGTTTNSTSGSTTTTTK